MNRSNASSWIVVTLLAVFLCACNSAEATPSAPSVLSPVTATPVRIEITRLVPVTVTPTPLQEPSCVVDDFDALSEIVLGALVPFSNPGAMRSGFAMQAALNIAVEDINASGGVAGKPVRLITYDTAGIPSQGAMYAERLIREDCVRAIVGIYHNNVASAVLDVAHRYGVPLILAEPMADELTATQYPEVFRIAPLMSDLVSLNARWLASVGDINGDGVVSAVNVVENNASGQVQLAQVEESMDAFAIAVKTILVDLPMRDFSPVIARIIDLEMIPDAVFVTLRDESALLFEKQLIDAGIGPRKQTLVVNNSVALNDVLFWQLVPDGDFTVVRQIGPWPSTVSATGHAFAVQYQQIFDRWPERYAFGAYDALRLAADAIGRAQSVDGAAVIAALEKSDLILAAGHYSFPYGSANPPTDTPAHWHQWMDSPMLFLQYTEPLQPSTDMLVIWPDTYAAEDAPRLPAAAD